MATALKGLNRMKGYITVGQVSMLLATKTSVEHKTFRVRCGKMDGLDDTCVTRLFALVDWAVKASDDLPRAAGLDAGTVQSSICVYMFLCCCECL